MIEIWLEQPFFTSVDYLVKDFYWSGTLFVLSFLDLIFRIPFITYSEWFYTLDGCNVLGFTKVCSETAQRSDPGDRSETVPGFDQFG